MPFTLFAAIMMPSPVPHRMMPNPAIAGGDEPRRRFAVLNFDDLPTPNCGWRRARVRGNLGNETAAAGSLHKFNPLCGGRLFPIVFD
jgi:hypothetical protein